MNEITVSEHYRTDDMLRRYCRAPDPSRQVVNICLLSGAWRALMHFIDENSSCYPIVRFNDTGKAKGVARKVIPLTELC